MTENRRVVYIRGRIAQLEAAIAALKAEDDAIYEQKSRLAGKFTLNLLEDRLWSALTHRRSRIPVLIAHAECEIEQFRSDLDRYYTRH